jgi:hypothetical protein
VTDRLRDLRVVSLLAGAAVLLLAALPDVGPLCPLRRLLGLPCPLCGLTTGVAETVHGDLAQAVQAHPVAPLVVLLLVLLWTPVAPRLARALEARASLVGAATVPLWAWQLQFFRPA